MRKIIFIACVFFIQTLVFASFKTQIDSLTNLAESITFEDPDKAITYYEKALELSTLDKDTNTMLLITLNKIGVQFTHGYSEDIQQKLLSIKPLIEQQNTKKLWMEYYFQLTQLYTYKAEFDSSIAYAIKALNFAKELKDSSNISYGYSKIAGNYTGIDEYKKSRYYHKKALEISEKINNQEAIFFGLFNIGITHINENNYDSCEWYLNKSLEVYEKNHLYIPYPYYYIKSIKLDIYLKNKEYNKFKKEVVDVQKFYDDNPSFKNSGSYVNFLGLNGDYNHIINNHSQALHYYKECLSYSDSNVYKDLKIQYQEYIIREKLELQGLASLYEELKMLLKDKESLYNAEKIERIEELEKKYETAEKDKKIVILENEKQKRALKNKQNLIILWTSITILILVILLISISVANYRKKVSVKIQHLRRQALQAQINPHFFFNALNTINGYIAVNKTDEARYFLSKFAKLMRLTLENSLEENDIRVQQEVEFITYYLEIEKMRHENFEYTIHVDDDIKNSKIPVMLLQPFIENSIKHGFNDISYHGKININIVKNSPKIIKVSIQDNGKGFNQHAQQKSQHYSVALEILRRRLKLMNKNIDTLEMQSKENEGVLVTFTLPYVE